MATRHLKKNPLWALALVAALGVGVAGCVHSGDSDDGPTQSELDAAEKARAEAEDAAKKAAEDAAAAEEAKKAAEDEAKRLQDEQDAAAAAAASEAAKELLNMALPDVNIDRDTDTTGVQPAAPTVSLSVSNDGMLKAEATDYTMSAMAPDMIEGFRGATLSNKTGDTAVVYSDIGNDGTVSLLDRYDSNLPTATAPRSWNIGADDNTAGLVPWSEVRRPDETTTAGGPSSDPITMFEGTVHGISGTFSCNADGAGTCVSPEAYSDGKVNAGTSGLDAVTWQFTPDEGSITYTDDMDYVTFGWWLDYGEDGKPDTLRLITDATIGGQAATARTIDNTGGGSLRGSATYEGAAAGKYAIASAADDTYDGGHFTATATLEVDFDADLAPGGTDDNNGVTLSGTIDNFMTGETARDSWSVALMVDNNETDGDPVAPIASLVAPDGARMLTEWSTGAAQSGTGDWTANWYGTETGTSHPRAVTGTFDAHIGTADADAGAVARLQGTFGANKQ